MRRSRTARWFCAVCVSITAGLSGDAVTALTTPAAPSVAIRRIALSGRTLVADVNRDGKLDLIASTQPPGASSKIAVALGNGDGSFAAAKSAGVNGDPLVLGDFNGDGKLDLIAAVNDATDMPLKILLGNGDGTFAPPAQIGSGVAIAVTFGLAADFNNDGKLDVAIGFVGEADDDAVLIYEGHGDGTFSDVASRLNTGTSSYPIDGAVADVNGDGKPDIVVANHNAGSVSVFLNTGAFTFTPSDIPLGRRANGITTADVNRDGKLDLVVAAARDGADGVSYQDGVVDLLLGKGNGTFDAPVEYEVGRGAWRVTVGDFNRDGILDIATANRSAKQAADFCGFLWDTASILPGNGNGTFAAASTFSLGSQTNPNDQRFRDSVESIVAADVNGDRQLDLIASQGAVLINQPPDPNWAPKVTAHATAPDANHTTVLTAVADDVDQDALTYTWTESGGQRIEPTPAPCPFTPTTGGVHTFTVTVDDGHGHTASSSVAVDFGSNGGGTSGTITFTAPAAGEVVPAGVPYTIKWTSSGNADNEHLSFSYSTDNGTTWTHMVDCTNTTIGAHQCTWNSPNPPTQQAIITAETSGTDVPAGGSTGVFKIYDFVPAPWQHADIGRVGAAGDASYSNGTFTLRGSGADIWNNADAFQFLYQRSDDFSISSWGNITTHVDSVQNVNAWTKAGVMIREGLGAGARHASLFVTPGKGIAFQRRTTINGASVTTSGPAITAPVWLKLGVDRDVVTAYYRKAATDPWTVLGHETFSPDFSEVEVGLAVTSHADGATAAAAFSSLSVNDSLPQLTSVDVGTSGGSTDHDGLIAINAKGADIWGTSDQFRYAFENFDADQGTVTAHVRSVQNVNAWTKAGVMFRESIDGTNIGVNAKYVFVMVTPGKGITMQYRATTGGTAQTAGSVLAGTAPGWVRLTKAGDTYRGYWSTDFVNWQPIGTVTIPMAAGRRTAGLAVTSHSTAFANAIFDDVRIDPQD